MHDPINDEEFRSIFHASPSAMLIIDVDEPFYTVLEANAAYLSATYSTREALIGQPIFEIFPSNAADTKSESIERPINSFHEALVTGKPHKMENYRYDILIQETGEFEERYWTTVNTPVVDKSGKVKYLLHSPVDVTELHFLAEREKAGIEALKNQREQLYSFFMQAPVGIGVFEGPDYLVELVNPYLCELYGKSVDEIRGKPIFDVLPHAKGHGFEELLDKVRLTGNPYQGQALPVPLFRNGHLEDVFVDFVYEPFRDLAGDITGVIAVASEVTDQVKAKKQLEEAEERARLAVDSVGLGTYDANLDNGQTVTSNLFARIFGFESPVPWDAYIKAIHPDDRPIRALAHAEALKTGKLFYEVRVVWPDQTIHWARIEGKMFYDQRKPIRILGTALDITEQKKSKEQELELLQQIADREQLLKNITSATPTGLWTADETGAVTYVNQTWIDWTGRPFEVHLKEGWLSSIIKEDRAHARDKFLEALSHRRLYELEFRILHVDGSAHWCVATGKPQYSQEGDFYGYVGAWVDITDIKQLQQQKDDFLGIASHELKTPVTSMKAYAQVLERMLLKSGNAEAAAMISKMDGQINRLTSLIGDLLDVTKMTTGKLQFNNQYFNFNELVDEVIDELQPSAINHALVRKFSAITTVFGDRERIGQVITNLVTNAVKYSPGADKVYVSTELIGNEVILSVQDFGIGIAPQNLDKIFEQFYRVSGDRQHTFPGLGLGLFISSEIIRREGGRIWVNSVEGEGSVFCFALPLKESTAIGQGNGDM